MSCPKDITKFNKHIQRQRLYQFLTGLNGDLDKERRVLLNNKPLPTVEKVYATVRREISRRSIMNGVSSLGSGPSEIGSGLAMQSKHPQRSREEEDRRKLRCCHYGGSKHTKESCFEIVGYSEWWDDFQRRRAATKVPASRTGDKAHLTTAEPPSSHTYSGKGVGCDEKREGETVTQVEPVEREKKERGQVERETAAPLGEEDENFLNTYIYTPSQTLKPHQTGSLIQINPTQIPTKQEPTQAQSLQPINTQSTLS